MPRRASTYTYCAPSTRLSGVSSTASRTTTARRITHGQRNRSLDRLPILPPVRSPKTRPTRIAKSQSNGLLGGESRGSSRQHLHAHRQRRLVDPKPGRMMGGRRVAFRSRAEHEVAAGDARQKLREVITHGERPAED